MNRTAEKVAFSSHTLPRIGVRLPPWASNTLPIFSGIGDHIRAHGPWRIETPFGSFGEMEKVQISTGWSGHGLILWRASEEELADFKRREIAVVLLSSEGPDLGFPRVLPDNEQIGREAAQHFLGLGLQSFAYLGRGETLYRELQFAPGPRRYSRERLSGFRDALKEADHQPLVHLLPGLPLWKNNTWRDIQTIIHKFLLTLPPATGLFTADDALGAVTLRAAEESGLAVPQHLAVLGVGDNLNYCHASFPSLSSIAYPARRIGRIAAQVLARQLSSSAPGPSEIIPPGILRQRESSDFIAIDDSETASLIHWIRKVAPHRALHVSEVTERSPYSPSTVKAKFRQYLGHGPKREIINTRLAHLKFLLRKSDLSFSKIAEVMQFNSPHELSRFLLRETGERPSAYREIHHKS